MAGVVWAPVGQDGAVRVSLFRPSAAWSTLAQVAPTGV